MSLPQRLTPITTRLAHILTARKTSQNLAARSSVAAAPLAIYFGGPVGDIYQVSQWTPIFEKFSNELPSVLLVKDARAASALAKLTNLPIRLAGHADAIEPLVDKFGIKAMFYVNNNLGNFSVLRLPAVTHIHLSHGESEKVSMVSNQLKAYDYCFVAGQASVDRILSRLNNFDESHLRPIGRPQLDQLLAAEPFPPIPDRKTVLYAPTWEGDRPAMAYSSVASQGEVWVDEVLADNSLRMIYRPHPKTGTRDELTRRADQKIRARIAEANKSTPSAGHLVDLHTDYNRALASADAAIFDVSAMAMDFRVLDRPFLISALDGGAPIPTVSALMAQGKDWSNAEFVNYHFGDTAAGKSVTKFQQAVQNIID